MIHERINISADGRVYMKTYIHDRSSQKPSEFEGWRSVRRPVDDWQIEKRPAVLIFPGGGYAMLSDREAEPVAIAFMRAGFNAFVLYYSIGDHSEYPAPLEDAAKAVWHIRSHAEEWSIDPEAIAVMGFSAGAHLAGLIGTQWKTEGLEDRLGIPAGGAKPNAVVISYGMFTTEGTEDVGDCAFGKFVADRSPEFEYYKYVDGDTPPMFIWHTLNDPLCPSKNVFLLVNELIDKKVPYELHIFSEGTHGMSLCDDLTDYRAPEAVRPQSTGMWTELCILWLKNRFNI